MLVPKVAFSLKLTDFTGDMHKVTKTRSFHATFASAVDFCPMPELH
jgi:hypothetical protein